MRRGDISGDTSTIIAGLVKPGRQRMVLRTRPAGFHYETDCNQTLGVIHLLAGDYELQQFGQGHSLQPGDTMVLTTGQAFRLHSRRGFRGLSIFEPRVSVGGYLSGCGVVQATPVLRKLAKEIIEAMQEEGPFAKDICLAIGDQLAARALADLVQDQPQVDDLEHWIGIAQQRLRSQASVRQDVAQCLQDVPFVYRYFQSKFTEATGVTPTQYRLRHRLDLAADYLHDSELSIEVIARRCGFSSPRHLSTAFKKWCGQTPSHYRRTCQQLPG